MGIAGLPRRGIGTVVGPDREHVELVGAARRSEDRCAGRGDAAGQWPPAAPVGARRRDDALGAEEGLAVDAALAIAHLEEAGARAVRPGCAAESGAPAVPADPA